jgi:septum site-determining protein MinC
MAQHAPSYAHDPPADPAGQIRVRGTRDGLLLSVPEDARAVPPRAVAAALVAHLEGAEAFFQGADVIIDLGERDITEDEVVYYRTALTERQIEVRGFTASSAQGRAIIRKQGYHPLQIVPPERAPVTGGTGSPATAPAVGAAPEVGEALYLRRTLRSGTRVRHHGHLVIVGDINAGAEVAASGDIVVWGAVRGMVHAGALGDDTAIICALSLQPTQLRIGSHYALPPSEKKGRKSDTGPERARLENGQVIVESW